MAGKSIPYKVKLIGYYKLPGGISLVMWYKHWYMHSGNLTGSLA